MANFYFAMLGFEHNYPYPLFSRPNSLTTCLNDRSLPNTTPTTKFDDQGIDMGGSLSLKASPASGEPINKPTQGLPPVAGAPGDM